MLLSLWSEPLGKHEEPPQRYWHKWDFETEYMKQIDKLNLFIGPIFDRYSGEGNTILVSKA